MKLIKKYQAGNTVQRDATRMKAPPPLIKKKEEARSLPNNQTYLSPKPQQSEYFDKQSRINATKREVSENLEKSKYNNFWTQPYSNFTGERAYGLATNLVKESMYVGAGEALGGLISSAVSKGLKNIAIRKAIKEVPIEKVNNVGTKQIVQEVKSSTKPAANFIKARDNNKLLDVMDEFAEKYSYPKADRSTILSNTKTNKQARQLIARHNTYLRGVSPQGYYVDDIKNVQSVLGSNTEDFLKYAATHKRTPDQGIWITPEDIKNTTWHELLHRTQFKNKLTLDKRGSGYYEADVSNPIAKSLKPYMNNETNWHKSVDEIWADLHSYRMNKKIGARDLTDNEAMEAMAELANH